MNSRSGGLRWLIVVAVIGVGAGIAIAGIPTQADPFTIQAIDGSTSPTSTSIAVPAGSTGPSTTVDARQTVPITFIGDSYTGGSDMGGDAAKGWTARLQSQIDPAKYFVPYRRYAEGGAGYVATGQQGSTFLDLATRVQPDTAIVIVFGSRNDGGIDPARVRSAADTVFAAIRTKAPGALLLVIGPPWVDEDVPAGISAVRDALQSAADDAAATFVDPLAEGWFFGADSALIGTDGVHPTNDGHVYMAAKILPHVQSMFDALG